MPGKNIEKTYTDNTFYHVYNRGLAKQDIFKDDEDYRVLLNLLKRTFGVEVQLDSKKREYPNFHEDLELLAYCLMPNHFHLLIRTKDEPKQLPELMRSVMTTYAMYFNKKYDRRGPLFGKRYRAVPMTEEAQLWHISRYIHLNPLDIGKSYKKYAHSSISYYTGGKSSDWVTPTEIQDMFKEANQDYLDFVEDYVERKAELKEIKAELY